MGKDHKFRNGPKHQHNHRGNKDNRFQHKSNRPQFGERNNAEKFNRYEQSKCDSLKENQIGITEYVSPGPGFTGIIKHRISDFQVNEIDLDGNVAKLTDTKAPKPPKEEGSNIDPDNLKALVTPEKFAEIFNLNTDEPDACVLIDVTTYDKTQRTLIHNGIKASFTGIGTFTIDQDEKKFIKCSKQTRKDNRAPKWLWPHEYTYFLMHKDNIDTMHAVATLSALLSGTKALAYAGTKDKRGRTTQWVSARRREPNSIIRAVNRLPNIFVGNFTFKSEPLKLGHLQGNRFRIALRQISADETIINDALEHFKDSGFINYYGLQRFGNHSSVPTYQIGLALVKQQFKEACELILKPRENDFPFMVKIRECWWNTRDARQALDLYNNRGNSRGIEQNLLIGFVKNGPNDYVNSLENIPRNVRLMYLHAYQSLLWNEIASRRIKEHGLKLCEGDLVYVNTAIAQEVIIDDIDVNETNEENNDEIDTANVETEIVSRFKTMVKPLTKADIDSGNYTIFDIVLPLAGHDITYPANECAQWYVDRLAQDDLSSEKLKQKHKGYSLTGAYRKLLIKPGNLSWQFMKYHQETDALIQSDIEELRKEPVPINVEDGPLKALVLDFCLPSSSYATMALREILKEDTSAATQSEASKRAREETAEIILDGNDSKKVKVDE